MLFAGRIVVNLRENSTILLNIAHQESENGRPHICLTKVKVKGKKVAIERNVISISLSAVKEFRRKI